MTVRSCDARNRTGDQAGESAEDSEVETVYVDDVDDDDLSRVLEALLLVVDTPVSAETLGSATEQPVHRITEILQGMAEDLAARQQRHRPARGRRWLADVHPSPVSRPTSSGC